MRTPCPVAAPVPVDTQSDNHVGAGCGQSCLEEGDVHYTLWTLFPVLAYRLESLEALSSHTCHDGNNLSF